jgi:hypothetical protein
MDCSNPAVEGNSKNGSAAALDSGIKDFGKASEAFGADIHNLAALAPPSKRAATSASSNGRSVRVGGSWG